MLTFSRFWPTSTNFCQTNDSWAAQVFTTNASRQRLCGFVYATWRSRSSFIIIVVIIIVYLKNFFTIFLTLGRWRKKLMIKEKC